MKFVGTHGESLDCPDFSEWLEYIHPVLAEYERQDIMPMNQHYFTGCKKPIHLQV